MQQPHPKPSESRRSNVTPAGLYIPLHATLRGRARWQTLDERGVPEIPRNPSGFAIGPIEGIENPNLITDLGLDNAAIRSVFPYATDASATWRNSFAVGTGSTAPAVTDTALVAEAQRAASPGSFANGSIRNGVDGVLNVLWCESTITRVVTMTADRNLTEYGLSHSASAGNLNIRELFRDGVGTPVTISLLNGKTIKLDHIIRVELPAPAAGLTGTVNIEEYDAANVLVSTTPYSYVFGPHGLTDASPSTSDSSTHQRVIQVWDPAGSYINYGTSPSLFTNVGVRRISAAWTYALNTNPTTDPSGSGSLANVSLQVYSTGTYTRLRRFTVPVGSGNAAWGGWQINLNDGLTRGWALYFTSPATYTKVNTKTLRVGLISTWARA